MGDGAPAPAPWAGYIGKGGSGKGGKATSMISRITTASEIFMPGSLPDEGRIDWSQPLNGEGGILQQALNKNPQYIGTADTGPCAFEGTVIPPKNLGNPPRHALLQLERSPAWDSFNMSEDLKAY
eukprot:gene3388-8610_t